MFQGPFDQSIVKRARDNGIVTIKFINIRHFGIGRHKTVDDRPYGGGTGMIFRVDVVNKAISKIKDKKLKIKDQKIILLTPSGKRFNQKMAKNFSRLKHLILVCGHYEGFDKRAEKFVDEKISVGDFITTGGEIPAMLITDAVVRLIKGVLKAGVTEKESFSPRTNVVWGSPYLEYPQYSEPRRFKNLRVAKILLFGNQKKIDEWQKLQSIKNTIKSRPDLLGKRKG